MGLFSSILEKIGIGRAHADGQHRTHYPAGSVHRWCRRTHDACRGSGRRSSEAGRYGQQSSGKAQLAHLHRRPAQAAGPGQQPDGAQELATELGCPADKMDDSAQMNLWLHKAVLKRLAENGGNVPADLLD